MSENKNENYMDGIISLNKALKWFKENRKFESKYRKYVNGGKDEFFTKPFLNRTLGFYNEKKRETYYNAQFRGRNYEADSSPKAWEHYIRHYKPSTFGTTKDKYGNTSESQQSYSVEGLKYGTKDKGVTRLYAVPEICAKNLGARTTNLKDASGRSFEPERLGGDCDFNFDGTSAFDDMLFDIGSPGAVLLDNCKSMHHSLLNFSLMQTTGDLQGLKRTFASERLDCFLSFLDGYYKIHLEDVRMRLAHLTWKKDGTVRACKNVANIACLNHYLSQFGNIYDYCAKIYFLPTKNYHTGMMKNEKVFNKIAPLLDKEGSAWHNLLERNAALINALITSGEKEFLKNTAENTKYNQELAKDYMRLAVQFWQAKEEYFKLMDTILSPDAEK